MIRKTPPLKHRTVDFSDRLSPMLVKELRQGLRTRIFTVVFIVIQAVMVLTSILTANEASQGEDSSDFTEFFWSAFSFLLIVVLPLRGFSALVNEIRNGSLEPVMITHLSAWRIVYGKWLALFSQTLLICLSIVPYVILRYFLGRVNLVDELIQFITLLLLSGLLTAIVVGFSSLKILLVRLAMIGMPLFFGFMFAEENVLDHYLSGSGASMHSGGSWAPIVALLVGAIFTTYYALDMGATYIAPEATNYSTRKRLIGVGVVLFLYSLMGWTGRDEYLPFGMGMVILSLIAFDALTEKTTLIPSVYAPFLKWGRTGKVMALFFAPGWTHGTFFFLLCLAIAAVGILPINGFELGEAEVEGYAFLLTAVASLMLPSAIICFLGPIKRTMTLYLTVFLSIVCMGALLIFTLLSREVSLFASALPLGAYFVITLHLDNNIPPSGRDEFKILFAFSVLFLMCSASFIVTGIRAIQHYRKACKAYSEYRRTTGTPQKNKTEQEASLRLNVREPIGESAEPSA